MTLSALGIFSAAGAGGAPAGAYELISTTILGSAQSSVVFNVSSFASTYKHLQIRATVRTDRGANEDILGIRFNGDTGSNYVTHLLYGTGSSVASGSTFSGGPHTYIYSAFTAAGSNTANAYSGHVVDLLDAYSTTKNTTMRQFFGQPAGNLVGLFSGLWRDTSAVSSITLFPAIGTTLNASSRFSLYGIKG